MDISKEKHDREAIKALKTPTKMDVIEKQFMQPLKVKITQILIYDSKAAYLLLGKYNNIEEEMKDKSIEEIIKDIQDLEDEIIEYERNDGKQKKAQDEVITMVNALKSLESNANSLGLDELENKLSLIKQKYFQNTINYDSVQEDIIRERIAIVQADIITRKIRNGETNLQNIISEEDKSDLEMLIYNAINSLMQNEDPRMQNIANEIKLRAIDNKDIVYDIGIWKLLDSVERGQERIEQREEKQVPAQSTEILLPALPQKHRGFKFPSITEIFSRKSLKIGTQRMPVRTTVQLCNNSIKVKELSKIDMEWLAERVPEQMLLDLEDRELGEDIRKKYIPDKKTPIYELFDKRIKSESLPFYTEKGIKLYCLIKIGKDRSDIVKINGNKKVEDDIGLITWTGRKILKIKSYVELIDDITGSDLSQQFFDEMGNFFKICLEEELNGKSIDKGELANKLPIFSNLQKSYHDIEQYVNQTKVDFEGEEKEKREYFYRKNKFRDSLMSNLEIDDNILEGVSQEQENDGKEITGDDKRRGETEHDGIE